jgi:protein SCO1/2
MKRTLAKSSARLAFVLAVAWITAGDAGAQAGAQSVPPPQAVMMKVGFDQNLDAQLPLDAAFKDETGKDVKLGDYFAKGKPVILTLVYYECPMLCTEVLNGLVEAIRGVNFEPGKDYELVTISFDPGETPELAAAKKANYVKQYGKPGAEAGWHFLTGSEESIKRVTETVGFRYLYDEESDQYAHASGIVVATPKGRTARYFYGMTYPSKDLRLGLVEASQNRIGNPVDYILLLCYHYDPLTGQYSMVIMNVLRLLGGLTVVVLAAAVAFFLLWERRHRTRLAETP